VTESQATLAARVGVVMRRVASAAVTLARDAGPWLRPARWSRDGLRALLAAAARRPWRTLAVVSSGALVLLSLAWLAAGRDDAPSAEVREGPFRVSIVEAGTLQALRSVTYASSIQSNQAKIVALAPEGKLVQKGDLLVLFDAAPFEEEIRRNQALLAQAQADLRKAREDVKLQVIQNREEIQAARLRAEKSTLELRDVQDGKGRLKEQEAAQAVASAERDVRRTQAQLDDLRPLLQEGFITRLELERAEQELARAREELDLAEKRRAALVEFGRPLELSEARSDAQASRETLRQLESAVSYRSSQKQAAVAAAESRIEEASAKLALARLQLARCEVRAEVPGIVVYRDVFFGSERRKPQVGDQVWASQPLISLPDVSRMVVETRVRETDIHRLERNQQVSIRVAAYPELRLTGKVSLVGTLAQEERERHGAKFFAVSISINESEPRLRPGMSARVEIEVDERPRALYVPLEAVFEREGRSLVFLAGRHPRPREVVLGPSNSDFVVIERGLARGERVLLRDPEAATPDFSGAPGS
jgi:HlyD family secretion protein